MLISLTNIARKNPEKILEEVAKKAEIREGKESIRLILREIYRNGSIGTKTLARALRIPIPTIAAARKELEKVGLIDRNKKGAILTQLGLQFVLDSLQIEVTESFVCNECSGIGLELPVEADELIAKQRIYSEKRPKPLTNYDQAFGKPITAIRRAYLMLEQGDLEGRNVLLLGDDDFTSLGLALLKTQTRISVVDIDERLLETITEISEEEKYKINCYNADLREFLPEELHNQFDVVLTDPPYTPAGLRLFLSRAIQALKTSSGKKIYLAFAHRAPNELLEIQKVILEHNLAIQQIIPGFNLYDGAELHANTTFLAILITTDETKAVIVDEYSEKIYTGEINPTIREYTCKNNHIITVGKDQTIKTIEELKEVGCPKCGNKESFTRISRKKQQN